MSDRYIRDKSKEQLLSEMNDTASPNSPHYGKVKMAIIVRCTQDLEKSILELKRKINFLDVMLVVASFIGAVATGLMAYKIFFP